MIQSGCLDMVDIITILHQLYPLLELSLQGWLLDCYFSAPNPPSWLGCMAEAAKYISAFQLLFGKLFQKEVLQGDCSCLLHGPCGCDSSQSSSCSSSYFQFAGFPTLWNQPCCGSKRHQPHLGRTPASAPGPLLQVSNNPTFSLRSSTPMAGSCFLHFLSL